MIFISSTYTYYMFFIMIKLVLTFIIFYTTVAQECVTFDSSNDFIVYQKLWEFSNTNCTENYMTYDNTQVIRELDHDGTANCIQGKIIGINLHEQPCINYLRFDSIHGEGSFSNATHELNDKMIYRISRDYK